MLTQIKRLENASPIRIDKRTRKGVSQGLFPGQGGSDIMDGSPSLDSRRAPLGRGERLALYFFFVVLIVFGVIVEHRSAFQHTRKGDLNVFLRVGWAVRSGADLYAVTDDNGFHYHYPPLLA